MQNVPYDLTDSSARSPLQVNTRTTNTPPKQVASAVKGKSAGRGVKRDAPTRKSGDITRFLAASSGGEPAAKKRAVEPSRAAGNAQPPPLSQQPVDLTSPMPVQQQEKQQQGIERLNPSPAETCARSLVFAPRESERCMPATPALHVTSCQADTAATVAAEQVVCRSAPAICDVKEGNAERCGDRDTSISPNADANSTPAGARPGSAANLSSELSALLQWLRTEVADTRAELEMELMLPGVGDTAPETQISLSKIGPHIEGVRSTLSQLVGSLCTLTGETDVERMRMATIELATRHNYGEEEDPPDPTSCHEDSTQGRCWFWELRDVKKALAGDVRSRKLVDLYRKRRKQLQDRLKQLVDVLKYMEQLTPSKILPSGTPPVHQVNGKDGRAVDASTPGVPASESTPALPAAGTPATAAAVASTSAAAGTGTPGVLTPALPAASTPAAVTAVASTSAAAGTGTPGMPAASPPLTAAAVASSSAVAAAAGTPAAARCPTSASVPSIEYKDPRLARKMARLAKTLSLDQVRQQMEQKRGEAFERDAAKLAALQAREREKQATEVAKRTARETEKLADAEAKEAERKRQRAEKEEAEAKKREETEAKRAEEAARVRGFNSAKSMERSQNALKKFFMGPARPAGEGTQSPAATSAGRSAPVSGTATTAAAAAVVMTASTPSKLGGGNGIAVSFTPVKRAPPHRDLEAVVSTLRARGAAASPDSVLRDFRELQAGPWRQCRPRRLRGVPPTWARRPSCILDAKAHFAKFYGSAGGDTGYLQLDEEVEVKLWRRKLLAPHIPSEGIRPPYYGSFTKTSHLVRPRRPFARDPQLDYDVESELEWEEEPEGERLSDMDDGEEAPNVADVEVEEDDSFVVEDGYLSADERVDMCSGDEADGPIEEQAQATTGGGCSSAQHPGRALLDAALERCRRAGRPLILSCMGQAATETGRGEAANMLAALSIQVLRGSCVIRPPTADVFSAYRPPAPVTQQGPPSSSAAATTPTPARIEQAKPRGVEAVAPEVYGALVTHLETCGERAREKVASSFLAAHPTCGLSKARLAELVRRVASYTDGRWKVTRGQTPGAMIPSPVEPLAMARDPTLAVAPSPTTALGFTRATSMTPEPAAALIPISSVAVAPRSSKAVAPNPTMAVTPLPTATPHILSMFQAKHVGNQSEKRETLVAMSSGTIDMTAGEDGVLKM